MEESTLLSKIEDQLEEASSEELQPVLDAILNQFMSNENLIVHSICVWAKKKECIDDLIEALEEMDEEEDD